ncbi:hypothetical protein AMS68_007109 [Peltaster fructicola]|uniref:NADH dehydrogenase [ubiquinone] 1 beta subcomplex subunit 11, mitochondrial n=1 Tax=Peltaster fructicola TaxID=286661 RepID=A0A6H0Y3J5_9PEZI|nr:hypothetical protein AMS68_007109 [Peltaster fructicola]
MKPIFFLLPLLSLLDFSIADEYAVEIDCTNAGGACNNDCYAAYKNKKPTTLHYLASTSSTNTNRRLSGCTRSPCSNSKYKYKNSGGDCDEYPYASTKEGGTGSTLRCVPAGENRSEGAQLGNFYKKSNAKGGCNSKPCTYLLFLKNYNSKTPYCTQKKGATLKNDGYEFKLSSGKFVDAKMRARDDDDEFVDDDSDDSEVVPLAERREFELEDGSRVLMLAGDYEQDYNGTMIASGIDLDSPPKMIMREKPEKEGWENIWYYGFCGTLLFGVVGYAYKPDTSIQTWALEEARRRLEAEGILEDPEKK